MDSATTPTPTSPLLATVEEYGGFSPYLFALASAVSEHYTQLLDGEKDEAVRVRLLNEKLKADSIIRLAR